MPRLSIVIPALGSLDALESTLVSVLQNRPSDCEVIVALDRAYDDPYDLSDEVRFVVVRQATGLAATLGAALPLCRGDIVHILAAGTEVDEGWTDAALEHFCDDRIAAVAPVVLHSRSDARLCSAGLSYGRGGRRIRRGAGAASAPATKDDVLGPTYVASFYRRQALACLPAAFDAKVSDALIDVDTALQLKSAGFRAVVEPRSVVLREAAPSPLVSPFAVGRGCERLFWRNAPSYGWISSLVMHLFAVVGELISSRSVGEKFGRFFGRIAALADVGSYRRHHAVLRELGTPGLSFAVTSTGDRIRIDAAHARTAPGARTGVAAEQRGGNESGRAA